jgi:predicted alpha-1,6-mannanase (GH76 family)
MHIASLPGHRSRFLRSRLLALSVATVGALPCQAHTAANATMAFEAFNKAFLISPTPEKAVYRKTTSAEKVTDFWMFAEELEMTLDVYERTKDPAHKATAISLLNGFIATHTKDWASNDFNDDICWASIAFSRAYRLFGDEAYKNIARHNFDLMYDRAWDPAAGGLFWKTDNRSKNACVEGPGAIAAYLLFQTTGETGYRDKANAIYDWEKKVLFNAETGEVYDNIRMDGRLGKVVLTYNPGTFIGAANLLGHPADAKLAANYVKEKLCKEGVLPGYSEGGDLAGFNGIFLRWMVRYMKDNHLEAEYLPWLQLNADAGWTARRADDNLAWSQWSKPTPPGDRHSWSCSSTVVALQVVPPAIPESK